eukprot:TRINITY_DN1104_c0_g1_i1.p1 TRINITY_DN1104_c0_g1~~TRINITY_DN1104_c0_g1_i1.p1  ORF type:complete len:223 (+),score=39.20 TRINITY_DN1104_c0_g1_i1:73-669(+)
MTSVVCLLGRAASSAILKVNPGRVSQLRSIGRVSLRVNALAVGDKIPSGSFDYFDSENNIKSITVDELCSGKKVVLFAVPGAFTPTCSMKHLPEFIERADEIKAKGVDTIACVAVNDAFVMDAWGKSVGSGDKVMMLADGSGTFTNALGVSLDLTDKGLGIRSRRYAMIVNNGEITKLNLEEAGAFTISGADQIISAL